MPGKNGTGPLGMGPKSGRGYGPCAGYSVPSYAGFGMGVGCGRGRRLMASKMLECGYPVAPVPAQTKTPVGNPETAVETQLILEKAALEDQV